MNELTLFLSLVSLIFFVGLLVMLRPGMSRDQAWLFALVLSGLSVASAVGSIFLTWANR